MELYPEMLPTSIQSTTTTRIGMQAKKIFVFVKFFIIFNFNLGNFIGTGFIGV